MVRSAPAELEERLTTNFVGAFSALAIGSGGSVGRFPGLTCHRSTIPFVDFNAAYVRDPGSITPAVLSAVAEFFGGVEEWFFVVPPSHRRAFERLVGEIRVARFGRALEMTLRLDASTVRALRPSPPDLDISEVSDFDRLAVWARTLSLGFDADPSFFGRLASQAFLAQAGLTIYLGKVAGQPVATSALFVSEGIAGVYAVSTIPEARGRGYGAAMSAIALRDGLARRCDMACLQASGKGFPVYHRMGFRHAFDYDCWWVAARSDG